MHVFERNSYTLGSPEMVKELSDRIESFGDTYPMELNPGDLRAVVVYLAMSVGFVTDENVSEETRERAMSLFSDIAESYHVEGI